jgi:ubiquitin-protein ligase
VDEDRPDVIKALVSGPEGTPYAGGLLEFDIFLPAGYLKDPLEVLLLTTGDGRSPINPNLYAFNGKVCLSLLGTWAGPSWNPAQSTLLQVLVSIQSLILVPEPFFNEPGFERWMNTNVVCQKTK